MRNAYLDKILYLWATEPFLVVTTTNLRWLGLPEEEFNALVAQKNLELQKLFATYGRTDTDILKSTGVCSLQNQVVDIAPEQYQRLRQSFLNNLSVEMLNQDPASATVARYGVNSVAAEG